MSVRECIKWHEDYVRWAKRVKVTDTPDYEAAVIALEALRKYSTSAALVAAESAGVSNV